MAQFNYFSIIQCRINGEWIDVAVYQANSRGKIKLSTCQERFDHELKHFQDREQTRVVSRREPVYL